MKPVQQYVDNKTGQRYYYAPNGLQCDVCDDVLDFVVLFLCWSKKKSFAKKRCFTCSKKHKQETEAEERIILSVVKHKPKNSKLVLITQPVLRNSSRDDSVFSNNLESDYINNKAPRSEHPDYTVLDDSAPAQIGLGVDEDVEAKKDKLIESVDELDALFFSFKNDQILIGDDEDKKRLSSGRDDG
jgi:hypothetical protein